MKNKNSYDGAFVSCIKVLVPSYRGAPYPEFDKMSVNESRFGNELHSKFCKVWIEDGVGYVTWISQKKEKPTAKWEAEIKRAFRANGLKTKNRINIKFGYRNSGYICVYDLYL